MVRLPEHLGQSARRLDTSLAPARFSNSSKVYSIGGAFIVAARFWVSISLANQATPRLRGAGECEFQAQQGNIRRNPATHTGPWRTLPAFVLR